jgi:hypothetical protein
MGVDIKFKFIANPLKNKEVKAKLTISYKFKKKKSKFKGRIILKIFMLKL